MIEVAKAGMFLVWSQVDKIENHCILVSNGMKIKVVFKQE